jgi:hypothetical protein
MAKGTETETIWSPYGHERARRALIAQRRAQIAVAALAIAVLYGIFLGLTLEEQSTATERGVEIEQHEQKPITVTVTPGRMTDSSFVDASAQAVEPIEPPRTRVEQGNAIVEAVQPFLTILMPLAAAFWVLSRIGTSAHGKLAELNLGVYKGAMPYELHAARAYKKVFTHRQVDAHVFGKDREDFLFGSYLGAPPVAVRRLLGEEVETAYVASLRRGGARVTVRQAPVAPTPVLKAHLERIRHKAGEFAGRVHRRDPAAARLRRLKRQARRG